MNWILLRGLMREARHWGEFPAMLRAAFPHDTVVTLDLPGNGSLWQQRSPATIAAMVEHCRRSLRDQGIAPPYHLLAISLGGMVAVDWSARYPDEVPAAALINTSMRPFNPFYQRLRPANYPALLNLLLHGSDLQRREKMILRLTSSAAARPAVLAQWNQIARECPVSRANALRQLLAAARFRAASPPPRTRLLLLASAGDWLVNPECSQRLARAWGSGIAVHPYAGHDLPLDDGPWVTEQVRLWAAADTHANTGTRQTAVTP